MTIDNLLMKSRKKKVELQLFSVRLPKPLLAALKLQAIKERRNLQPLMAEAIEMLLKQRQEDAE